MTGGATHLLAFGVLNALALGGLGLAAVPIIIHWLSRRRFQRVRWAATRFLLEAERQNRRRTQLEQWLLLALRCLIMLLLALLIARPFVRPGLVARLLGGEGAARRVILIDDSASLSFRGPGGVDLERLTAAADRLLGWIRQETPDDWVGVFLTSRPEPLAGEPAALQEPRGTALTRAVRALRPVATPAQPRERIEALAARLREGADAPTTIYVFSDFQKSDWAATGTGPDRAAFAPLAALTPPPRVVLVGVGAAPRPNVAISEIGFERPQILAGVPAVVRITVVNHGPQPLGDARLNAAVGEAPLPALPLETLAAGAQRSVSFEAVFPEAGYRELTTRLATPDGFALDDVRRAVAGVKPALRVLVVNGQPAADPAQDEVFLLQSALAPPGSFSSGVVINVTDPDQLEGEALAEFDAIVLANVPPLAEPQIDRLEKYASAGGGLLIFLGDNVADPVAYSAALRRLLPLPLEEIVSTDENSRGVQIARGAGTALQALFSGDGELLSEQVFVRKFVRCGESGESLAIAPATSVSGAPSATTSPAPSAVAALNSTTVLARFTNAARSPALIERTIGEGRVWLFPSTVDLDWNDWARAPDGSYVVALLEIMQQFARRDAHPVQTLAGERLAVPLIPEQYELAGVFRSPRYPEEPAVEQSLTGQELVPGRLAWLSGPRATQLGSYRVELTRRPAAVELRPLAVNLPPAESDLAVLPRAELAGALGGLPHEIVESPEEFLRGDETTRRELWPAILITLVVLLVAEQSLAWWFGALRMTTRRGEAPRSAGSN